jgi:4-hydroxybenzoate polyprenyltransferase
MGLCRGLNLLLGLSILPAALSDWWFLGFIPMIYIASITMISRGEVHGGSRIGLYLACLFYGLVIGLIFFFAWLNKGSLLLCGIFLALFAWMIFDPLVRAIREPVGRTIGRAVKAGVIGLILMNASWASASNELFFAVGIALLLPVSIGLARMFAVT